MYQWKFIPRININMNLQKAIRHCRRQRGMKIVTKVDRAAGNDDVIEKECMEMYVSKFTSSAALVRRR